MAVEGESENTLMVLVGVAVVVIIVVAIVLFFVLRNARDTVTGVIADIAIAVDIVITTGDDLLVQLGFLVADILDYLSSLAVQLNEALIFAVETVFAFITQMVQTVVDILTPLVADFTTIFQAVYSQILNFWDNTVSVIFNGINDFIQTVLCKTGLVTGCP